MRCYRAANAPDVMSFLTTNFLLLERTLIPPGIPRLCASVFDVVCPEVATVAEQKICPYHPGFLCWIAGTQVSFQASI